MCVLIGGSGFCRHVMNKAKLLYLFVFNGRALSIKHFLWINEFILEARIDSINNNNYY